MKIGDTIDNYSYLAPEEANCMDMAQRNGTVYFDNGVARELRVIKLHCIMTRLLLIVRN